MLLRTIRFAGMAAVLALSPPASGQQSDEGRIRRAESLSRLIQILEDDNSADSELAMRAIGDLKSEASQAVPILCQKLQDRRYWIRAAAIDALVAIGEPSAEPARELFDALAVKFRAAPAEVLRRLSRLQTEDIERLAMDDDPRARVVCVRALATLGAEGVPTLVARLSDHETAVAVAAARALRVNHGNAEVAIAGLIAALPRQHVGWASADALGSYGTHAQRAVPWIIKAHPLGEAGLFGWEHAAEEAIQHIGPPHEDDIPLLVACLADENMVVRALAADSLGLLGLKAKSAAAAIESSSHMLVREHQAAQEGDRTSKQGSENDTAWRISMVRENFAIAVWKTTRDPDRFLALTTHFARSSNSAIDFAHPTPWTELPTSSVPEIEKMLRDSNSSVRWTALRGIEELGPKALPLKEALLTLTQAPNDETANAAISALADIGAAVSAVTKPQLLARHRAGKISLRDFASMAKRLELRSPEVRALLYEGLQDRREWTVAACLDAVCVCLDDPRERARLIIDTATKQNLRARMAVETIATYDDADDLVVPFLRDQLKDKDHWTRHDALEALSQMGKRASPAVVSIGKLLEDKYIDNRLMAASAILLITGDAAFLDGQLKGVFAETAESQTDERIRAIQTIASLGSAGDKYLPYVQQELTSGAPYASEFAIESLEAIGTLNAIKELRSIAESTDWRLRSAATEALDRLRSKAEE